jgi:P4 family phage/plasmid primase-like protien
MNLQQFLQQFVLTKKSTQKSNITSIKGGKWYIPEDKMKEFYDIVASQKIDIPLVEKINDIHPLIFDLDLKYKSVLTERSYTEDAIESLIEHLWKEMKEFIDLSDYKSKGTVLVLEKEKPYPCNKGEFKSKDGIHLIFPDIIIDKKAYKKIVSSIVEKDQIKTIFDEGSEISPDNSTSGILDSSFSSWQLYGCGKTGESPYLVNRVYKMGEDDYPDENLVDDYYSNPRNILNLASMCYRDKVNIKYTSKFDNTLKKNSSSKSSVNMSNLTDDDIYGKMYYVDNNNVINPFKIVEEEQLKLVKALVKCLSKERAEDYGKWFDVALCLHNINVNLLDEWKEFSRQAASYDPNVCDSKWESINNEHGGERLGIGSLMFWAKNDNPNMYLKAKEASLSTFIHNSARNGADADYLVGKVIYEYYKDEFISVNVKDEWYYFNGHRWERTLEGTILKTRIHTDIYNLYSEYEDDYRLKKEKALLECEDEDEKQDIRDGKTKEGRWLKNILSIKLKLLQGNYVNGVMKNLRDMFYEKSIMEKFDTDTNLLGFDNGIYDLKNNVFREGRPEDYVTMSTKVSLPVKPCDMPIKLDQMIETFSSADLNMFPEMRFYDRLYSDLDDFLNKIVPIPNVKKYTLKFLAKCLSGENRDEGFYIWTGTGGNGKSKLIDLTSLCMGDYSCNLPIALLTQKRKASGAASPEMALTMGKRLCVMQEPDVNETMNIGQMKELTGNDKIQARALFKEPFFFTPQFKLVCMCNDLPNIPSNDDGTWRRLEVVDFVSKFVDSEKDVNHELNRYIKDKTIKNKIPMWIIPFFAMLLPNWRDYDENGIDIPDEIKAKTNEYRGDNDIIGQWIEQYCETADNVISADGVTKLAPTEFRPLYDNFSEFCGDVLGRQSNNIPDMSVVKTALKKWQEKSDWGLCYGKRKDQSGPNGYEACMRFNLVVSK